MAEEKDYKYYNKYSQQDKDSMRTAQGQKSNEQQETLLGQTDELEGLGKDANTKLDSISVAVNGINGQMLDFNSQMQQIIALLTSSDQKLDNLSTQLSDAENNIILKLEEILEAIKAVDASVKLADTDIVAAIEKNDIDIVAAIMALNAELASKFEMKTLDASNINNTPGTFFFKGVSGDPADPWPDINKDWSGLQISSDVETWQIIGANGYWVRHYDGVDVAHATASEWTAWSRITTVPAT